MFHSCGGRGGSGAVEGASGMLDSCGCLCGGSGAVEGSSGMFGSCGGRCAGAGAVEGSSGLFDCSCSRSFDHLLSRFVSPLSGSRVACKIVALRLCWLSASALSSAFHACQLVVVAGTSTTMIMLAAFSCGLAAALLRAPIDAAFCQALVACCTTAFGGVVGVRESRWPSGGGGGSLAESCSSAFSQLGVDGFCDVAGALIVISEI